MLPLNTKYTTLLDKSTEQKNFFFNYLNPWTYKEVGGILLP